MGSSAVMRGGQESHLIPTLIIIASASSPRPALREGRDYRCVPLCIPSTWALGPETAGAQSGVQTKAKPQFLHL